MEDQLNHMWEILMWGFGICASGFFILCGWNWALFRKMSELMQLDKTIIEINKNIQDIKISILGSFDKKGLISKYSDVEARLSALEDKVDRCQKWHEEKK